MRRGGGHTVSAVSRALRDARAALPLLVHRPACLCGALPGCHCMPAAREAILAISLTICWGKPYLEPSQASAQHCVASMPPQARHQHATRSTAAGVEQWAPFGERWRALQGTGRAAGGCAPSGRPPRLQGSGRGTSASPTTVPGSALSELAFQLSWLACRTHEQLHRRLSRHASV